MNTGPVAAATEASPANASGAYVSASMPAVTDAAWRPSAASIVGARDAELEFVPGELLVTYEHRASELQRREALASIADAAGPVAAQAAVITREPLAVDAEIVHLPSGADVLSAAAELGAQQGVARAEPNYIAHTTEEPNDTFYQMGFTWGMYGAESTPTNAYGSNAAGAWAQGFTGSDDVYVAVIDEGIDVAHKDLASNIWVNAAEANGIPGADDDGNGYVDDVNGYNFRPQGGPLYEEGDNHGTHIAGIIGAVGNNGEGVVGVAWKVKLISAKAFHRGEGDYGSIVRALDYVTRLRTEFGLRIVATNNSWGGAGYSGTLLDAIGRAADAGVLFVASAGNDSANNDTTPRYPSSFDCSTSVRQWDCVIAVAATGGEGLLAGYSNYGATSVDLGAPGTAILSTVHDDGSGYQGYAGNTGTSMAAPFVTGAIALCASADFGLSGQRIRQILLSNTAPTPDLVGRTVTEGRLDVGAMMPDCAGGGRSFTGGPVDFTATAFMADKIRLEWTDGASGEFGQEIQMATGPDACTGAFRHVAYLGPDANSYTVLGLMAETTYCFRVRAFRESLTSDWTMSNMGATWSEGRAITGIVKMNDGSPMANATVRWVDDAAKSSPVTAISDDTGAFGLQTTSRTGTLYLTGPNSDTKSFTVDGFDTELSSSPRLPLGFRAGEWFTIPEDVQTYWKVIDVPVLRNVTVHVVDKHTGAPVQGASLSAPSDTTPCFEWIEPDLAKVISGGSWHSCSLAPAGFPSRSPLMTDADGNVIVRLVDELSGHGDYVLIATDPVDATRSGSVVFRATAANSLVTIAIPHPPSQPLSPSATASLSEVTLAWNQPSYGGTSIDHYRVSVGTSLDGPFSEVTSGTCAIEVAADHRSCVVAGLSPGTTYFFAILAHNEDGDSAPVVVSATTKMTVPGSPVSVGVVAANGSAKVSWLVPVSDGGSPVVMFQALAYDAVSGGVIVRNCSTAGALSCTVTGLANGSAYFVAVRAKNAAGWGAESSRVAVTPGVVVGPPSSPTSVSRVPGNAQVQVAWGAPASDGGSAVSSYQALAFDAAVAGLIVRSCTVAPPASTCTITGLVNGTTYYVATRAKNASGWGAQSTRVASVPVAVAPGLPRSVTKVASSGQVVVSWVAPVSDGGSPVITYQALAYDLATGGVIVRNCSTAGALSCTITGLTNGTTYYLAVRAKNAAGWGAQTDPRIAVTPATAVFAPGAPTGVGVVAGSGQALVSWSAPVSDGGSPVITYLALAYDLATGGVIVRNCSTAGAFSCTVTGLTDGVTYHVAVRAKNAAGWGVESGRTPVTPVTPADTGQATTTDTAPSPSGAVALTYGPGLVRVSG